jgi:hypothetical protein
VFQVANFVASVFPDLSAPKLFLGHVALGQIDVRVIKSRHAGGDRGPAPIGTELALHVERQPARRMFPSRYHPRRALNGYAGAFND